MNSLQTKIHTANYVATIAIVVICTGLARLMLPFFERTNIVMVYILAAVFIAVRYGRGPSILASILGVAAFDFFFVPPYLTFAVSDAQYIVTFIVMLIVSLVISTLTVTIKQQAESAKLRAMRTAALYSLSRELAQSLDKNHVLTIGVRQIAEVFESQVAVLISEQDALQLQQVPASNDLNVDIGVAEWVNKYGQPAGLSTNTLPGVRALYVPLRGAKGTIGVVAIRPANPDRFASQEQLRLLETFGNQMALAYERALLTEESEQAKLKVRTEQMRSSLLSSVSHDLRTPLATISGAASSIVEGTKTMNLQSCKLLAKEIYDESMRLNRLVTNLLDMTRVQSGNLQIITELHAVDEIIGSALTSLHDRIQNHSINTRIPSHLPFVSVDSILIQQVLINLIDNACKYTPVQSEVDISAESGPDSSVTIAIADSGPGVPLHLHRKVFEKFYRHSPGSAEGVGLGLAICSGIIEAHAGKIWVENRMDGGAVFKFTLPATDEPPEPKHDEMD